MWSEEAHNTTAEGVEAAKILTAIGIKRGADFHALTKDQVFQLERKAIEAKYRRPPNANGSKARYYHALLQRRWDRLWK